MAMAMKQDRNIEVEQLLEEQVRNGFYRSSAEADRHTIAQLIERDIDRGIQKSREQHKNGDSLELNQEYIDKAMEKLAIKYMPPA
ncbi:MAG: hypothetical protein HRT90_01215 [Candidatus Margulisbacteria bacterium]|nr:hypothetical protein [Candidatus Margulisiibacteriota bacterium]